MDKLRLEYERKKKGVSVSEFCAEIGISTSAYYRKCDGKTQFTLEEINRIVDYLGLESPMEIFFADRVSEKTPT